MTMGTDGGYGVHWERTQTWWDFVPAYHLYLSRCQQILRRGLFVADILYLTPEGAPNVFFPPRSAFRPGLFADRRGYNFDGCAAETLIARASVKDGRIVFPDGMSYRLLVLPRVETMTPRLLEKIVALVEAGATVLGAPPQQSPSLSNYPDCDRQVRELAARLWPQGNAGRHRVGRGRVILDAGRRARSRQIHLTLAKWIWCAQRRSASTAGTVYFTREFTVENSRIVETAVLTITADQSYELSLNGRFIVGGNAEQRARRIDISSLLRSGANRFTVSVKKKGTGQSGLIASLAIALRDGTLAAIETDRRWTCSLTTAALSCPRANWVPTICRRGI